MTEAQIQISTLLKVFSAVLSLVWLLGAVLQRWKDPGFLKTILFLLLVIPVIPTIVVTVGLYGDWWMAIPLHLFSVLILFFRERLREKEFESRLFEIWVLQFMARQSEPPEGS